MASSHNHKERALVAFLDRYWKDRDGGDRRPLAHYLGLFPGHEKAIAREYLAAEDEGDAKEALRGVLGPGPDDESRLGPYRIREELGRGGQGSVWLAEDTRLKRPVALKVLTGLGPGAGETLRRFHKEAQVASKLDHPEICAVHDAGVIGGVPYIAMRHVEGQSLARLIEDARHGAVPAGDEIADLLLLVERVARALHAAHEAGVVHRDVKPGNIMVTADGSPVVLDFGLARDDVDDDLTRTGDVFGTPAYMSPEQIATERHPDRRTDIWSLGVTLYEALTTRHPFEAPTRHALYLAIQSRDPEPPRRLNPHIPSDLEVVLMCALDKNPDRRYRTADAFAAELRRIREHEPVHARPAGAIVRFVRWRQRNPALAACVLALFLTLVAGIAVSTALAHDASVDERYAEVMTGVYRSQLARFERLADASRLQGLQEEQDDLWPTMPAKVPAMEEWLTRARGLAERLPVHEESLRELRQQALPYSNTDRRRDRRRLEREIDDAREEAAALAERIRKLDARDPGSAPASWQEEKKRRRQDLQDRLQSVTEKITILEGKIVIRRTWRFARVADQWRHDQQSKFIQDLQRFTDPAAGTVTDVERRMRLARAVATATLERYAGRWRECVSDIRESPVYRGLAIKPQLGLVPIGRDPSSGLWEFVHLVSGKIPQRESGTGRLELDENTGIVFVLVPGGRFRMGAQSADPAAQYDPQARADEGPVHDVQLDAFFLAKHEMTQAQWLRCTGANPSSSAGVERAGTLMHPVEMVSFEDARLALERVGLTLPTEAQWEFACRSGTTTPWFTGADRASLAGSANVADRSAQQAASHVRADVDIDDGYAGSAPVGSYRSNAFGLHDMHGNVWEWCRDRYAPYGNRARPGDGLRTAKDTRRVLRGSSYLEPASRARSSMRRTASPATRDATVGLRPARVLDT